MNEHSELHGTLALVRPDLENDPYGQQGKIGIVTYVDMKDEVYLSFNNGKEGIYPGDALLQLKGKNETLLAAINNTSCLQLDDYKALYKISLLQDLGRGKDIWQALEIARDHPGIWEDSLVGVDQAIGSKQTQLVGR
jgi:hypothetical protein